MWTDFQPIAAFVAAHERTADRQAQVALLRPDGVHRLTLHLHADPAMAQADAFYTERMVKTALWMQGGCRLLTDDRETCRRLQNIFAPDGTRAFDSRFMAAIYGASFTVELAADLPAAYDTPLAAGGGQGGCRIGIDLGGSDRKAAAVRDGEAVYTEEVIWSPKTHADPSYHYREIVSALRAAAAHLPQVDAVGFSTAGVVVDGKVRRSGLFMQVPEEQLDDDLLRRAVRDTFGTIPCAVCNDGDVTALAGAMRFHRRNLLGIAMGTSEAGGFVNAAGQLTGWLNELAFLPVDVSPHAPVDPWSGDHGVGERYFSQEGVLRLAALAGLSPVGETPAERLLWVQNRAEAGDFHAKKVFSELGEMLAQTLPWYWRLTGCESVLLLGRVLSGQGGQWLLEACRAELFRMGEIFELLLPDEKFRRLGQAAAAAYIPDFE